MIAIVDYGMGNLRSLSNAFEYLGEEVVITHDVRQLDAASRIVLPGVGAFEVAMNHLNKNKLVEPLTELVVKEEKPIKK